MADIEKLNIRIHDGVTKIGEAHINPIVDTLNEVIDKVNNSVPATNKVLIAGDSSNLAHGHVSVHGLKKEDVDADTYLAEIGEYVVLHAISNTGYQFVSWNDGFLKKDRTILVDPTKQNGTTYTAHFAGSTVVISVSTDDSSKGSVSVSKSNPEIGEEVTISAEPTEYYQFKEWQKDGVKVQGANATYTFKASVDAEYKAIFEAKEIGTIRGTADYIDETKTVTIESVSATSATGYKLKDKNTGAETSLIPPITISQNADYNIIAYNDITGKTRSTEIVSLCINADDENPLSMVATEKVGRNTGGVPVVNIDEAEEEYEAGDSAPVYVPEHYCIKSASNKEFEIKTTN